MEGREQERENYIFIYQELYFYQLSPYNKHAITYIIDSTLTSTWVKGKTNK